MAAQTTRRTDNASVRRSSGQCREKTRRQQAGDTTMQNQSHTSAACKTRTVKGKSGKECIRVEHHTTLAFVASKSQFHHAGFVPAQFSIADKSTRAFQYVGFDSEGRRRMPRICIRRQRGDECAAKGERAGLGQEANCVNTMSYERRGIECAVHKDTIS